MKETKEDGKAMIHGEILGLRGGGKEEGRSHEERKNWNWSIINQMENQKIERKTRYSLSGHILTGNVHALFPQCKSSN